MAHKQAKAAKTTVRHAKLRRSSSLKNTLKALLAIATAVAISIVSVAVYALWDISSNIKTVDIAGKNSQDLNAQTLDGAANILIVGSDSRQGQTIDDGEEGELNDVTMLLHISEDHKKATVVSFPRDTMLPIPSCPGPDGEEDYYPAMSEQQLNSALMYGLPCVARTIEELTGAEIPYAGLITFDGVINMSNAIGGVEVCLAEPIVDPNTDLDLPAGNVTLQGIEALQFLRTRYGVGDGGDTSRISNQQVFLSALLRKVQSGQTLTNPAKVYNLAKAAVENMTLSSNMASVQFMQSAAATVAGIDIANINFVQYPTAEHPYETGRLVPDYANGELLMQKILNDEDIQVQQTGAAVAESQEDANGGDAETAESEQTTESEQTAETDWRTASTKPEINYTTEWIDGEEQEGDWIDGQWQAGVWVNGEWMPGATSTQILHEWSSNNNALPENITGQNAAKVTCSAGRTSY